MTIYEEFLRAEAPRRGIAYDVAATVAGREGGLTEAARLGDFSGPPWYSGKSWWAYQLHYGGAGYESWGTSAGMGNDFTRVTGWRPGDPQAWRDAMRWALDRARAGGWGPWYGAKAAGITGFDGIDRTVPWTGTPDTEWDYKQGTMAALKLSEVLARARSQITTPPKPYVWGGKNPDTSFDCSGFVAWCYGGAVTSFTDAILGETVRVEKPAPGDIVLYQYQDESQPGVAFPHVAIYLSDTRVIDARYGVGIGEHDQLPRTKATRYYRRVSGVVVDTEGTATAPTPAPADARDATIARLTQELADARNLVGNAYNQDGEVRKALAALQQQIAALDTWLGKQAA
jgi:hypothetical protein